MVLAANALCAQTVQQAEALWADGNHQGAYDIFRAIIEKDPKNPDLKVQWGRFCLDRAQSKDAQELFGEALEIKKDHAGALLGFALLASQSFETRAIDLAKKALESDPKLTEAQELLAYLALEDNDNKKAEEEAKKAL